MFKELGVEIEKPVPLFCDSKAVIQIATHPIFHERTKHIDIDCHFVTKKGLRKTNSNITHWHQKSVGRFVNQEPLQAST